MCTVHCIRVDLDVFISKMLRGADLNLTGFSNWEHIDRSKGHFHFAIGKFTQKIIEFRFNCV